MYGNITCESDIHDLMTACKIRSWALSAEKRYLSSSIQKKRNGKKHGAMK